MIFSCVDLLDIVITFRKPDASIRLSTFEAEPSGDIWFQFKTTAFDGIMVHQSGKPDFVKIAIASEFKVKQPQKPCHKCRFIVCTYSL